MNSNLLKAKIAEKGVTQSETAQAIGMSLNSLSRKLLGKREFRVSEVISLCQYLNINNPVEIFLSKSSQNRNDVLG